MCVNGQKNIGYLAKEHRLVLQVAAQHVVQWKVAIGLTSGLLQAFWVSHDGRALVWVPLKSQGQAPSARFHHSANTFDGELAAYN